MANWVNKKLQKSAIKKWKGKTWRPYNANVRKIFEDNGEGLYYSVLKQAGSDIWSKLIAPINKGLTHVVPILYSQNLRSWFSDFEWEFIKYRWGFYYNHARPLDDSITTLVLGSADKEGMNYFDFSTYQSREFSIRKVPDIYGLGYQNAIAKYFVHKGYDSGNGYFTRPYDATGLAFWPLFRAWDDPSAYYCSEWVYDGFNKFKIKTAAKPNPSVWHMENYNKEWIVHPMGKLM